MPHPAPDIPRLIRVYARDNVAIVANDFGLDAGTRVEGLVLPGRVPQGHMVALRDIPKGAPILRYGVEISYAAQDLPAGAWVNEHNTRLPVAPAPENTEVRDGIAQLTARAASPEIARQIIHELSWYDAYLARGGADRAANTTPGNKVGGLSNIVEKAMGSIAKSGAAPISGVVAPGDRAQGRGLLFCATPASDFMCGTLQLAAGATVHVFTTGRGTPYSLQALPTIKVATRSDLARRWHDLMDVDAGPVATGACSLDDMGRLVFEHILAVASGKRTWAEQHGLHNALVLFNPAPVT